MKKAMKQTIAIILLALAIGCTDSLFAQNVTKDAQGNYKAISRAANDTTKGISTGKFYEDEKGVKYPVFESAKGKLYIIRISKNTNMEYKMYLKL